MYINSTIYWAHSLLKHVYNYYSNIPTYIHVIKCISIYIDFKNYNSELKYAMANPIFL